jgi:MoaA/NifB/PqqE/SkfB family radical SAM enzyme
VSVFGELARVGSRAFGQQRLDSLILFVTSTCNLRCEFCCYAEHLNRARDISRADMRRISESMPAFRALLVSGGEPFLRRDIAEVMGAFVENNGVENVNVPTNGWYLEPTLRNSESFVAKHPHATFNVSFSVDALANTHDRVRGRAGSFDRACRTLEAMQRLRCDYPNLRLRANTVVTLETVDEVRAVIDFFLEHFDLDEHAVALVRDPALFREGRTLDDQRAIADRYVELVEYSCEAYAIAGRGRGERRSVPESLSTLMTFAHNRVMADIKRRRVNGQLWDFPCTAGRNIIVITDTGTLRACEHRGAVVDLRDYDFDVSRALASGGMARERAAIREDRCDCVHGCFIGNSIQHSGRAIMMHEVPQAVKFLSRRAALRARQ